MEQTRSRPAGVAGLCGRRRALGTLAAVIAALAAGMPPRAAAPVTVELVDHAGLMAAVAAHRGRVVVLDCWSTSCPPCVREFPNLVALAAAHPGDVACLSLAFDYDGLGTPDDAVPAVREFLESVAAHDVHNMLSREEADVMYRKLELTSVPAVFVWGPDGTLAARFDDDTADTTLGRPFTYADVAMTVRELLATKQASPRR
ncbi:MAG: TlpA family protein disulfide reductase [Pirellulales bacterium]